MHFTYFVYIFCLVPNISPKQKICNFGEIIHLWNVNSNLRKKIADLHEEMTELKTHKNFSETLIMQYKTKINGLEAEIRSLKNITTGIDAVLVVRHDLERIDKLIDMSLNYADKESLIEELKKFQARKHFLTENEIKMNELTGIGLPHYSGIRHVRWLHYLTFSDQRMAYKIRTLLNNNKVSIPKFCKLVDDIFSKVSGKIHDYLVTISTDTVLQGLRYFGIQEHEIIQGVEVLRSRAIRNVTMLFEGTLTTIDI